MCRVLKHGSYLYLNVPSHGAYTSSRSTPGGPFDAGLTLRDWARANHYVMDLSESFITKNKNETWSDCVMVFTKEGRPTTVSLADRYDVPINARCRPRLDEFRKTRRLVVKIKLDRATPNSRKSHLPWIRRTQPAEATDAASSI
jgi:hypothetical protein